MFLLHNKERKLTALCHVSPNECAAETKHEKKKFRRVLSALHAFAAYASHHHQNEWKIYFENPSPNAVNALYLIAFKNFVRNIYVNKSADWKGWNKVSAASMAINKRFSIYCDELMELMGLEKPLKKNIQRDWKLKFPTMTIF